MANKGQSQLADNHIVTRMSLFNRAKWRANKGQTIEEEKERERKKNKKKNYNKKKKEKKRDQIYQQQNSSNLIKNHTITPQHSKPIRRGKYSPAKK